MKYSGNWKNPSVDIETKKKTVFAIEYDTIFQREFSLIHQKKNPILSHAHTGKSISGVYRKKRYLNVNN